MTRTPNMAKNITRVSPLGNSKLWLECRKMARTPLTVGKKKYKINFLFFFILLRNYTKSISVAGLQLHFTGQLLLRFFFLVLCVVVVFFLFFYNKLRGGHRLRFCKY